MVGKKKIDDVGEKLEGAKKFWFSVVTNITNIDEQSLKNNTLSKLMKPLNVKRLVKDGTINDKEALFLSVLMSNIEPRPKKVKHNFYGGTNIDVWAKSTVDKLNVVKDYLLANKEDREKIFSQHASNPIGETYNEKCMYGNITKLKMDVMNRLGYQPGDSIADAQNFYYDKTDNTYFTVGIGETGIYKNFDELIHHNVVSSQIKDGVHDIQLEPYDFKLKKNLKLVETGEYYVIYGFAKTKENLTKEKAEEFAAKHEGGVYAHKKWTPDGTYSVTFRDLDLSQVPGNKFNSKQEALTNIANNLNVWTVRVNDKLADKRAQETKKSEEKKNDIKAKIVYNKVSRKFYVLLDEKFNLHIGNQKVSPDFKTFNEANNWYKENKDSIKSVYESVKNSNKTVYFDNQKNFGLRIGTDYRHGKDVTAEDFMNTFGFRGVQFGNWANQKDRQMAVNNAYDAFLDMAKVLKIDPKSVSLGGTLGIAFGARGSGSANAHYEPSTAVINITKTRGAGSLAHEWFHALDNYVAKLNGRPVDLMTEINVKNPITDPKVNNAFDNLEKAVHDSPYAGRSKSHGTYWGRPCEMAARLFAEWTFREIEMKGENNPFLSRGFRNEDKVKEDSYLIYQMGCKLRKEEVMDFDKFKNLPIAMGSVPYTNKKETLELGVYLRNLFNVLTKDDIVLKKGQEEPKEDKNKEKSYNYIISSVANYNLVSAVARHMKKNEPDAITKGAELMTAAVESVLSKDRQAILIPVPNRSGDAVYTLQLAKELGEKLNLPVLDALKATPHAPLYTVKKDGIKPEVMEMNIYKVKDIPQNLMPILVDNVLDTGTTAKAAYAAIDRQDTRMAVLGDTHKFKQNEWKPDKYPLISKNEIKDTKKETSKTEETKHISKDAVPKTMGELYDFFKEKHPNAMLLFRAGDFYETYKEDAEKASEVLGITLTKNPKTKDDKGKPLALAAFPHHRLDTYLPKLIRAGNRVAICDKPELEKTKDKKEEKEDAKETEKETTSGTSYKVVEQIIPFNEKKTPQAKKFEEIITVNGDKITMGGFNKTANAEGIDKYQFSVNINGTKERPMYITKEDYEKAQKKEISFEDLVSKYYPTKLMKKISAEEYIASTELSDGRMIDKMAIYKDNNPDSKFYGKYMIYAQVGDQKMSAPLTAQDRHAYFDRVITQSALVEKNFGERLNLKSFYEQFQMPVQAKDIRSNIVKDAKDGKWYVTASSSENNWTGKAALNYYDGRSFFKEKTATKEQLAMKYLGTQIKDLVKSAMDNSLTKQEDKRVSMKI